MVWGKEEDKEEKEVKEQINWLEDKKETIMVYGLPKHGKTYAYCSIMDHYLKNDGVIYVISTDAGFIRTAKTYFGEDIKNVYKKIHLEVVYDINSIRNYFNKIKSDLKPNDLLIIDLLSDIWEWAQMSFVEKLSGEDVENFVANAMRDQSKFGLFDSNKWNYIKALHKFVEDIIVRKPCSFVGVCIEKDVDVEIKKGGAQVKENLHNLGFDDLTTRPGGYKLLPYKFETIVRIGTDGKKHFMQIIGDRGYNSDIKRIYYDNNMYKVLLDWRNKQK